MTGTTQSQRKLRTSPVRLAGLYAAFVFVLLAAVYLFRLGDLDFWESTEARPAEVAREMIATDDYLIPRINGELYLNKPPLYAWLVAFTYNASGHVNEREARLPSVAMGLLCLAVVFVFGRILFGPPAGLLSVGLLASSLRFFTHTRQATLEIPLTLFVTAAYLFFYLALRALENSSKNTSSAPEASSSDDTAQRMPHRAESDKGLKPLAHPCGQTASRRALAYFTLFHLACGLAFLDKGHMVVFLVWIPLLVYLIIVRRLRVLASAKFLVGLIPFLVIAASWYVAIIATVPGALDKFKEVVLFKNVAHIRPFYYYVYQLPLCFSPWLALVPLGLALPFRKKLSASRQSLLYLFIWIAAVFVLFSAYKSKQTHYLLPIYPAVALLVAGSLVPAFSRDATDRWARFQWRVFVVTCVAVAALSIGSVGYLTFHLAVAFPLFTAWWLVLAGLIALLALGINRNRTAAFVAGVALGCVLLLMVFFYGLMMYNYNQSAQPFADWVATTLPADVPLYTYYLNEPEISFYLKRNVNVIFSLAAIPSSVFSEPPREAYLIVTSDHYDDLSAALPAYDLMWKPFMKRGRTVYLFKLTEEPNETNSIRPDAAG